ncbi:cation:proton antiporter [bacterium]|nr:cation:proton antiporter [bacterium]
MEPGTALSHILDLLIILGAAKIGAEVMVRFKQPPVIGELLAGVVVGGSVLGLIHPEGDVISTLAEVGVILLLFEVGMETDLGEFVKIGPQAILVALIGIIFPFGLGYYGSLALGLGEGSTMVALFVGAAMTATSVGITARVFADLKQLGSKEARTVIGAAVVDDILGLVILATVVGAFQSGGEIEAGAIGLIALKAFGFFAGVILLGKVFAEPLFKFLLAMRVSGSLVVGAFIFAAITAVAAERLAGLAPIVGAFAAGMVVADTSHDTVIRERLRPIGLLLIPIFFLSIGAQVDLSALASPKVLIAGGVITLLAMAGKILSGWGAFGQGINRWVVGWGMLPRGEVGLIFASIGLSVGLVGPDVHGVIILMVVLTTLIAPMVLTRLLGKKSPETDFEDAAILESTSPHVGGGDNPL